MTVYLIEVSTTMSGIVPRPTVNSVHVSLTKTITNIYGAATALGKKISVTTIFKESSSKPIATITMNKATAMLVATSLSDRTARKIIIKKLVGLPESSTVNRRSSRMESPIERAA